MVTVNMLGKPCPIPVVEAKKALSQPGVQDITVLVDNAIAVQNLKKMADGLGYDFSFEQKGETEYAVIISTPNQHGESSKNDRSNNNGKLALASLSGEEQETVNSGGAVFLLTADQIGISAEEPGKKLMKSFLYSLTQLSPTPAVVLLLNTGVRMAVEGSDNLADLRTLADRGTDIRSCGQCLSYYDLTEKLAVGSITNMMDIVETLTSSAHAITL